MEQQKKQSAGQAARRQESREKRGRHTISEMPGQEAFEG